MSALVMLGEWVFGDMCLKILHFDKVHNPWIIENPLEDWEGKELHLKRISEGEDEFVRTEVFLIH